MLMTCSHVIVAVACFGAYALAGRRLTLAGAYSALSMISLLRVPLATLPSTINTCIQSMVALKRISAFLAQPEVPLREGQQLLLEAEAKVRLCMQMSMVTVTVLPAGCKHAVLSKVRTRAPSPSLLHAKQFVNRRDALIDILTLHSSLGKAVLAHITFSMPQSSFRVIRC